MAPYPLAAIMAVDAYLKSQAFQVTAADLSVAARTLWGECRGEPLLGQQAVAWVIRTRAAWRPATWWGHSVYDVCLRPHQFSCWNPSDPNYPKLRALPDEDPELVALREVARAVMAGEVEDPTGGATNYEVVGAGAAWAKGREFSKIIGKHAFYVIGPM